HRLAGTEKHLAVVAPALLGRGDTDLVEALGDGGGALVGGEDPLARRNHLQSGLSQSFSHECDLPCMSVTDIAGPYNGGRRRFHACGFGFQGNRPLRRRCDAPSNHWCGRRFIPDRQARDGLPALLMRLRSSRAAANVAGVPEARPEPLMAVPVALAL